MNSLEFEKIVVMRNLYEEFYKISRSKHVLTLHGQI